MSHRRNKLVQIKHIVTLLMAWVVWSHAHATGSNVVIILADDLGWMDINPCAGFATGTRAAQQYYETPHISKLAKDGVTFTRCYSMPLCTPSRATLITGCHGATFGFNNAASMRAKNTFVFVHEPYYRPDLDGETMMSPSSVIIEGDYKLIAYHDGVMRLYDLGVDIGEQNDLSASMPQRVTDMKGRLAAWRFTHIPARYDTRENKTYDPQHADPLPRPQGPLFVR